MVAFPELKKMTRTEKLQAMEFLWDELSRDEDMLESPAWHKQALRETKARMKAGITKISSWDEAQKRLQRKAARFA